MARAKSATGTSNVSWFAGYAMNIWGLEPILPNATKQAKTLTPREIRKIDDYTVRINQKTPNELFPRLWTTFEHPIFDITEAQKHATTADPWAHRWSETQSGAGFGPYCLRSWSKGREMVLTANPNYFRGQPEFKTIIIRKVPQNANRVAAIQSGAADIVMDLTPQEFDSLKKGGKVNVPGFFNNRTTSLIFGFKFAPWNIPGKSKLLRQAFAYAMPYDQIVRQAYFGEAKKWNGQVNSAAGAYFAVNKYKTDLNKARQLLRQAGFPNGQGLEQYAQGLSLYYPAERASIVEPVATAIRTSLQRIGVPISLHPIPIVEFAERQLTKHDMGMNLYDFGTPYGADMSYAYNLFFLKFESGGILNSGAYVNPATDRLFVQSQNTVGARRAAILKRMTQILMDDLPQIPLVEWKHQIATRKGLTCFIGHPDDQLRYWFITTGTCKANLLRR
jgi:peptide/nickel transport system substrate-binding protein